MGFLETSSDLESLSSGRMLSWPSSCDERYGNGALMVHGDRTKELEK